MYLIIKMLITYRMRINVFKNCLHFIALSLFLSLLRNYFTIYFIIDNEKVHNKKLRKKNESKSWLNLVD